MKKALMTLVLATFALMVKAQGTISGKAVEADSGEPLPSATVKLLKRDSTLVKGVVTDYDGNFRLAAPNDGKFIFKNYSKDITVSGKNVALGKVSMKTDAIMLEGATVTANAAKVTLKEDTFVYNVAAYRTPEGSVGCPFASLSAFGGSPPVRWTPVRVYPPSVVDLLVWYLPVFIRTPVSTGVKTTSVSPPKARIAHPRKERPA